MTKPPNGGVKMEGLSVWVVLWIILKNAKNRLKQFLFNYSYFKNTLF
ncbi:hypothetical protein [Helicobacter pylori]|nr:hypothetical protein [Helicobacter pylori]